MSKGQAAVLGLLIAFALFAVPATFSSVSAGSTSGISPEFNVDETHHMNLTGIPLGTVVTYHWYSDDYLEFSLNGPNGLIHYYYPHTYDVSESYGFVADIQGNYSLSWTNHNIMNTAIVTYWANWSTPQIILLSPVPGGTVHSLHPGLSGTCDAYATTIRLSTDNVTFTSTTKQSTNWIGGITLQPGMNDIYVKMSYQSGQFLFNYTRVFAINAGFGLDFQPSLELVSPAPGSITHVLSPTVTGTCDDNATSVSLSKDNITFVNAQKQGSSWSGSIHLTSGQNTVYAMATYVRGDFSYSYFKQFTVTTGFGLDFTPNIGLVSPKAASTINDLTPQLTGICDENASWIVYSQDNFTFFSTLKQGPNWRSETPAQLSSGQNTIYVKATYQRGDFWYNYTKAFSLSVDTTWIYQKNGSTNLGIGTIGVIITVIAIAGVGGFILFRRSGRKKP